MPFPTEVIGVTLNVYAVPFVSPVTGKPPLPGNAALAARVVKGVGDVRSTKYPVIDAPPVVTGALQFSATAPSDTRACNPCTAVDVVTGVA